MQNLGHWRAGVKLNAVFLGEFCDCLNHRVKPTLRVENTLVHVNVCHQVIHARSVIRRSAQEHSRKVQRSQCYSDKEQI